MNFLRKFSKPSLLFIFSLVFLFALFTSAISNAAFTGAIDSANKTARFYDDNANLVNFRPSYEDPTGGSVATRINETNLSGFAWGNTLGWINLNSMNCDANGDGTLGDGNFDFCPGSGTVANFKVSKTGDTLSGYAWSENGGWINFGPFISGTAQVTINPNTGNWSGYAWVENYGWLQFDCGVANGCVQAALSSAGGGGGGTPEIYGTCSSANGGTFSSAPTELCTAGTASPSTLSGDGPWTWDCLGNDRGFDNYNNGGRSCSANFSPIAPPPPTTCEDEIAENFGGELPCVYRLEPPIELCIIGTDCEPLVQVLPPTNLCIIGTNCEAPTPPAPILPTIDRPTLLCILGFSCDPGASVLPTIERPSLLCIFGFSCDAPAPVESVVPIVPVVPVLPVEPTVVSPEGLCIKGVDCPTSGSIFPSGNPEI